MVEITIMSGTPEAAGWQYRGKLASPAEPTTPIRGSAWGLLRLLKKS
jgi:hypothetical protein